jgi:cytidylate kinase
MTDLRPPVIAIDGPSGSGKGTIAHLLARDLGWHLLDSGALYRVVAIGSEELDIAPGDVEGLCRFAGRMDLQFSTVFPGSIVLAGQEISDLIRLEESGAKASRVAVIPELRQALLQRQYAFRQAPGLVADGRDMGTVVFPDAILKIFLTASAEVRADRRYKQLINKGVDVNLRALLLDIRARDERDSSRAVAPLVPAADAVVVDTDALTADQVYALVKHEALSRLTARV